MGASVPTAFTVSSELIGAADPGNAVSKAYSTPSIAFISIFCFMVHT